MRVRSLFAKKKYPVGSKVKLGKNPPKPASKGSQVKVLYSPGTKVHFK